MSDSRKNGGTLLLANSSVVRSSLRVVMSLCFLSIAGGAILVNLASDNHAEHFAKLSRLNFIFFFMFSQVAIIAITINDHVTRKLLAHHIDEYFKEKEERENKERAGD